METLKTLKGSKIQRSKYGVGKQVGSQIYVHKNYAKEIVPKNIYEIALTLLPKDFVFNCIMYDKSNPWFIRFDSAENFNSAREPSPGNMVTVDVLHNKLIYKHSDQIWHHKWMWVKDDYDGFDVLNSWMWSERWLGKVNEVASGYMKKWNAQLFKYGIDAYSGEFMVIDND